jgi:hypothetical protein
MDRRTIFLVVSLFGLIVLGMFTFAYLKSREAVNVTPTITTDTTTNTPDRYADITRVDAKHFYQAGVHTFVGEIPMPTPCDLLEADAVVVESNPEQVRIDFSVINNAESCIAQISMQRFQVTASASRDAQVTATFMNRPVTLNLIPAQPGESPEDFELFIKG